LQRLQKTCIIWHLQTGFPRSLPISTRAITWSIIFGSPTFLFSCCMYDSSSQAPSPQVSRGTTPVPPSPDPRTPAPNNLRLASPNTMGLSTYSTPEGSLIMPSAEQRGATGLVGAYEAEAGALGSFWKKWALKLARAIAIQFHMDSRSYKYKSHLAEFSNTSYSQQEG